MRALALVAVCASSVLACADAAFAAPYDTTLVSRASTGVKANGESADAAVSGDGRYVAFWSRATNLSPADGESGFDLYRRDRDKDTTVLVSRASGADGVEAAGVWWDAPAISADGRVIAFMSDARNLSKDDPDDLTDIFVRDVDSGETTLVSRASGAAGVKSNQESRTPAISADGRFVAFASAGSNLATEQLAGIYVRDRQTQTTTLVSRMTGAAGAPAPGGAGLPAISGDGRFVAFSTRAKLSPDDDDPSRDVYLRDLLRHTTALVSRASGVSGADGRGDSRDAAISADGRLVAFRSTAANLSPADADTSPDIYVRDRATSTTRLVSRATGTNGAAGDAGDADSYQPAISGDGRHVAFTSDARNLSGVDVDAVRDVFVRDTVANTTTLLSRAGGAGGAAGNGASERAAISADGRIVAFGSSATNLSTADALSDGDEYTRELPLLAFQPLGGAAAARKREPYPPARLWYRVAVEFNGREVVTDPASGRPNDFDASWKLASRNAFRLTLLCVNVKPDFPQPFDWEERIRGHKRRVGGCPRPTRKESRKNLRETVRFATTATGELTRWEHNEPID